MEIHPLCDLFPPMAREEFSALAESIAKHGLIDPIVTYEGMILDGRHRWNACTALGVSPRYEEYTGDSPVAFVVSRNLHRRHLSASQRATLAVEVKKQLEDEGRERMRQGGRVGAAKTNGERGSAILPNPDPEPAVPWDSREQAAELCNVSPRYVGDAERIADEAPEAFEAVKRGEMTIPQAKRSLAPPREPSPRSDDDDNWINIGRLSANPAKAAKVLVKHFEGVRLATLIDCLSKHAEF